MTRKTISVSNKLIHTIPFKLDGEEAAFSGAIEIAELGQLVPVVGILDERTKNTFVIPETIFKVMMEAWLADKEARDPQ